MKTAVYLSGESVLVCSGRATGKKLALQSLVRGQVPSPEEGQSREQTLATFLPGFWREHRLPERHVSLVLDPGLLQVRTMDVPLAKPRELLSIIENEFLMGGQPPEEMLYDYAVLKPGSKAAGAGVLAASAPRSLIASRLKLFEGMGVRLDSIDVWLSCMIRLTKRIPALAGESYILGAQCGSELQLLFFLNGEYRFSNTVQLTQERGAASAVEIARQISTLLQFNTAQRTGVEIGQAYLCGMEAAEQELFDRMSDYLGIPVNALPDSPQIVKNPAAGDEAVSDYVLALGGLLKA